MRVRLQDAAWSAIEDLARLGYPNEVCGVLLGHPGEDAEILEAHPCVNVNAERSQDRYLIDPVEQLKIEKDGRLRSLEVVGYFHSHPDHPALASQTDLDFSWEELIYLIASVRDGRVVDRRAWMRPYGVKAFMEVALERALNGTEVRLSGPAAGGADEPRHA